MRRDPSVQGLLITGVFGSGKSSVAEEIADILEKRSAPYAILDLDWLGWFDTGTDDGPSEYRVMLTNLVDVVGNYLDIGVRYFVLARHVRDVSELESLKAEVPLPLRIVRLTASLEEIKRRLSANVTTGRQDDLRRATLQVESSEGEGIEEVTVANDRSIRQVAMEVLDRIGWS